MANTYTQLHIQAVFAVQNRDCILRIDGKGSCTGNVPLGTKHG